MAVRFYSCVKYGNVTQYIVVILPRSTNRKKVKKKRKKVLTKGDGYGNIIGHL